MNLNPVRAGIVPIEELMNYRSSSYWYLFNKCKRPAYLDCSGALDAAGGLKESPAGRKQYEAYLKWLSTNSSAQKEMAFEKMCRGRAVGTKDFKKALLKEAERDKEDADETDTSEMIPRYDGKSLREANELRWEILLDKGLSALTKDTKSTRQISNLPSGRSCSPPY
ncbi:MAG: hypothetical protein AAF984_10805 [Verrucomicrobiota bacterium]